MKQLVLSLLAAALVTANLAAENIMFIRGGAGTVGFFEGGSDEQGADIDNYATNGGNHGWGELNAALIAEGFSTEQIAEDPVNAGVPTPIPLDTMDLSQYAIIVFGSNNAEYTAAQVDAFMAYIAVGGAALFISDANFGQNWGDAPSSDQHFFDRFGLTMNQDRGTYTVDRAVEFLLPSHPIFNGVDTFDGEGVSPITVGGSVAGVTRTILAEVPDGQQVRRNTSAGQGSSSSETASDGTLVVATFGAGRIAGHFDRNTFFNLNGAGTNLNRFDNEAYARNLFNWLAGKPSFNPATDNYAPRVHFPDSPQGSTVAEGVPFAFDVVAKDADGSVVRVELWVEGALVDSDTTSPYSLTAPNLAVGSQTLNVIAVDNEGGTGGDRFEVAVQDSAAVSLPLDRSSWVLSANRSTGELGNAIDGDLGSRWPTREFQQPGQLFGIDFGERRLFERIVLETPNNPDDYPRGYVVRGSHDGVNFVQITSGAGTGATTEIVLLQPRAYRFVEIEQTGSSSNRWWSIHEINVYAPPVNSPVPAFSWHQFYFGDAPYVGGADGDGDGRTRFEEYAAGTDPTDAASVHHPTVVQSVGSDGKRGVTFTFRRWREEDGARYMVVGSNDLEIWGADGFVVDEVGAVPNRDGTENASVEISFPEGAPSGFARLEVYELN